MLDAQSIVGDRRHCWMVASLPVHFTPSQAIGPVPSPKAAFPTAKPALLSPNCSGRELEKWWLLQQLQQKERPCSLHAQNEGPTHLAADHGGGNIIEFVVANC